MMRNKRREKEEQKYLIDNVGNLITYEVKIKDILCGKKILKFC